MSVAEWFAQMKAQKAAGESKPWIKKPFQPKLSSQSKDTPSPRITKMPSQSSKGTLSHGMAKKPSQQSYTVSAARMDSVGCK